MNNITEQERIFGFKSEEETIDFKLIGLRLLSKWKNFVLAILIGAVVAGIAHQLLIKPTYQVNTKLYVTNTDSSVSVSDLQISSALAKDYKDIVLSRMVLKQVIGNLNLSMSPEALASMVTVEIPEATHILKIYVTSSDEKLCVDIANALTQVSCAQIYQVIGTVEPTIIDYAEAGAVKNKTPAFSRHLIMGALIGFVLMLLLQLLILLTDTTIKSEEDVESYLGLPVLATVLYEKEL